MTKKESRLEYESDYGIIGYCGKEFICPECGCEYKVKVPKKLLWH